MPTITKVAGNICAFDSFATYGAIHMCSDCKKKQFCVVFSQHRVGPICITRLRWRRADVWSTDL